MEFYILHACEQFSFNAYFVKLVVIHDDKKRIVILELEPSFLVEGYKDVIMETLRCQSLYPIIEQELRYPLKRYRDEPVMFQRLKFQNPFTYKRAMKILKQEFNVMDGDSSMPFMPEFRKRNISLCGWCRIEEIVENEQGEILTHIDNIKSIEKPPPRMLICGFDGEMVTVVKDEITDSKNFKTEIRTTFPLPGKESSRLFMLAFSFRWTDEQEPFRNVVIMDKYTDIEYDVDDNPFECISVGTEKNIICESSRLLREMNPHIVLGFNDGSYDWPFILEILKKYNYEPFFDFYQNKKPEYLFKHEEVKLEAGRNMHVTIPNADYFDFIPVDSRILSLKGSIKEGADTKTSSSLRYYLEKENLAPKVDLPYEKMFEFYAEGTTEGMGEIAKYCSRDATGCLNLFCKKDYLSKAIKMANMTYTRLYDSFYRADSMRVMNTVAKECDMKLGPNKIHNYCTALHWNDDTDSFKYKGAFVAHPEKGLEDNDPVSGLDFASLYPSLIRTYNLSPDCFLGSKMIGEEMPLLVKQKLDEGYCISETEIQTETNDKLIAYYLRHSVGKKQIDMGIFARIMTNFAARRKAVKNQMKILSEILEIYEMSQEEIDEILPTKSDELIQIYYNNSIQEIKDKHKDLDNIQYVIKILMNTFYGTTGSKSNPMYLLELASSITAQGQINIKFVINTVEHERFFPSLIKFAEGQKAKLLLDKPYNENGFIETKDMIIRKNYDLSILSWISYLKNFDDFIYKTINKIIDRDIDLIKQLVKLRNKKLNVAIFLLLIDNVAKVKYGDTDSAYTLLKKLFYIDYFPEEILEFAHKNAKSYILSLINDVVIDFNVEEFYYEINERIKYLDIEILHEFRRNQVKQKQLILPLVTDYLNSALLRRNGLDIVQLAYEEVLFPVMFVKQKMYFGIPHVNYVNFNAKIFTRNLFKRDHTNFQREITKSLAESIVRLPTEENIELKRKDKNFYETAKIILLDYLRKYDLPYEYDLFEKKATYNKDKDNKMVKNFIKKLEREGREEEIPNNGVRFSFVFIEKPKIDYKGYTVTGGKAEKMEFTEVAKEKKLPLCIEHYLEGILNRVAMIITSSPYWRDPKDYPNTKEKIIDGKLLSVEDVIHEKAQKNVAKKITQFIKEEYNMSQEYNPAKMKKIYKEDYKKLFPLFKEKTDYFISICFEKNHKKIRDFMENIFKCEPLKFMKDYNKAKLSAYANTDLKIIYSKDREVRKVNEKRKKIYKLYLIIIEKFYDDHFKQFKEDLEQGISYAVNNNSFRMLKAFYFLRNSSKKILFN